MKRTALLLLLSLIHTADACTTLCAARGATSDGSVMVSHSNDGDGATAGNIAVIPAADWALPASRHVSGGEIPQVAHTNAYITKVGGYAQINEKQVALAESTCVAVFKGNRSAGARLNIVDVSELGLERANSSRAAVLEMGRLAETYGYYDAGESLFVADPREAWIFHVLPDPSGTSALWVGQRVPDGHVGVVANSFTVRAVDFDDEAGFLAASSLRDVATRTGRWAPGVPFDFTRIFAGAEPGHKYSAGRRMWRAYQLLAPAAAAALSPTYKEYVSSRPYPATLAASNVSGAMLRDTMRDYYARSPFDLTAGVAAGPFGSPARWHTPAAVAGAWERPIAIVRTILSYVASCRKWLPDAVGGVLWLAMHAAHTSVYVPLPAAVMAPGAAALPNAYTANTLARADRGVGAWQASRFVFNAAQLHFSAAIGEVVA